MVPQIPNRYSTTEQKLSYILALISDLGLESPLHVFQLQLRDAHERGRRANRYRSVKEYLDSDRFLENITNILGHPLIPLTTLCGGMGGARLIDEVFIPIVSTEVASEMVELSNALRMGLQRVTHTDLLSMDFALLEKQARRLAPRLWCILERVTTRKFRKGWGERTSGDGGGEDDMVESDDPDDADYEEEEDEEEEDDEEFEEDEEEDFEEGEDGEPQRKRKRPRDGRSKARKNRGMMIAVILSMLCYTKTNRSNKLQGI